MTFTFHSGAMTSGTIAFAVFILAVMAGVAIALLWLAGGGGAKHPKPWEMLPWPGVLAITFGAVIALLLFALGLAEAFRTLWPVKEPTLASALGLGGGNALGKGALIVALLGAPLVIWGTWLKHRSVSFQQEGHITDRISKAVEQLGAEKVVKALFPEGETYVVREETQPNIEVRIGGLLSLQRISEDSMRYDKGRDHIRVMQIVCAYIRKNSPVLRRELPTKVTDDTSKAIHRIDIQIALDVIRKRSKNQVLVERKSNYCLDLRECDLSGFGLSGADLTGAIFRLCKLHRTVFEGATLCRSNFIGAYIYKASFLGADLTGANLTQSVYVDGYGCGLGTALAVKIFVPYAHIGELLLPLCPHHRLVGGEGTTLVGVPEGEMNLFLLGRSSELPEGEILHPMLNAFEVIDVSSDSREVSMRWRKWCSENDAGGWPFEG